MEQSRKYVEKEPFYVYFLIWYESVPFLAYRNDSI